MSLISAAASVAAKLMFVEATQPFVRQAAKTGLKTVTQNFVVMGGAVVIYSCKDQSQKNHVTESVSSRDVIEISTSSEETERKSRRKDQNTCAESQRDTDTEDDEDSYGEDEDGYGEDEDGYGEDEGGYGEDEDEGGYGEDGDGYGEDEDEGGYGEDEDGYGEDEGGYGEDGDGYGEDDYGEDEGGYGEDGDGYGEDDYGEDEDGYGEDGYGEDEDEGGYGEDEDGYGEDEDEGGYGEDEDGYGEDEGGYGEDGDGYGEDEDGYGEDDYGEDEDGYDEDEDGYGEVEDTYGEDYEDEDIDEEEEEFHGEDEGSEIDEEQEDNETKWTSRKRRKTSHQQKVSKYHCSGQDLKTICSSAVRVGLLNLQSLNNKTPEVLDVIARNALDVLCTTETWLEKHSGHRVLRDASPKNFSFHHQARAGRGGGVAIQFLNTLKHRAFGFNCRITTFEAVAAALQHDLWDEPVLIITVYRPPGSSAAEFHMFLDQFEELLRRAYQQYSSIVVAGDFNIWVDPENRSYKDEFLWLLPIYELEEHVREPTHEAGHCLDLVLTRNVEVSCLDIRDDRISDHYTVYFKIKPKSVESNEDKPAKRFRTS